MSYQALARQWRPKDFQSLVGQQHVIKALTHALDEDRLHHAYLLTGTRGVGKTTLARIFAKALNCEEGVSSQPCGKCSSCVEIDQGRFADLIEVDAASRTGVDDTRELLDNVQYAPTRGRYKIYLIDEVHMFSKSSFNALLKTLEEPPPHVKFILATTDPQKLPVTILSRCLQFSLKQLDAQQIQAHLAWILEQESIAFEAPALNLVAHAAEGSVRDSLSLLDQAIAYSNGQVTESDVRAMLGLIDAHLSLKLLEALANDDVESLYEVLKNISESLPDYDALLSELIEGFAYLAMAQQVGIERMQSTAMSASLNAYLDAFDARTLQLYYQIAVTGRKELVLSPNPKTAFEMLCLRMLAFHNEALSAAPAASKAVRQSSSRPAPQVQETAPVQRSVAPSVAESSSAPARSHLNSLRESLGKAPKKSEAATKVVAEKPAPAALIEKPAEKSAKSDGFMEKLQAQTQVAEKNIERKAEAQAELTEKFLADPKVKKIQSMFNLHFVENSVRPIETNKES